MTSNELREKYIAFFEEKGHAAISSASLIPENDPTVLFTTAGMHPLVPFLTGEPHPSGKRLVDSQKCIRTGDIDEVGDNRHLTFFEMLGNWSLGDYFKQESIVWSYEFLTSPRWLNIDPRKLYVTIFAGDDDAPRDLESLVIWQDLYRKSGIDAKLDERIFAYGKKDNWWGPAGLTGPCGPDTEIFYDTGLMHDRAFGEHCEPSCDCGRFIEIWNNVFMEYDKKADGSFFPLVQKNVDTGMGLERTVAVLGGKDNVYEIDTMHEILGTIEVLTKKKYGESEEDDRAMRIIADHIRAAVFIIGDPRGVTPSNVDQGYVLRRLIRRAVRYGKQLGVNDAFTVKIAETVIELFGYAYPELIKSRDIILNALRAEEEKFSQTLQNGLKEVEKVRKEVEGAVKVPGDVAFYLYESFGFPKELTEEVLGKEVDASEWGKAMEKHQALSRKGAEKKFAGGLADHSWATTRLHTATHLMHRALKNVLGEDVSQKGSNITADRLRFDFNHPEKMTPEQKTLVEDIVNQTIAANYDVNYQQMTVEEAKEKGAIGLFGDKYGEKVKVYSVGEFSTEICGGPHVASTGQIGKFRIKKEEASSAGVRRIKAVLEDMTPDGTPVIPESDPAGLQE